MILIDANLLVYAKVADFDHHEAARSWLDGVLAGRARTGLPWESLTAFVRLTTNPRVFDEPLAAPAAMAQVVDWLDRPAAWVPQPTDEHASLFTDLIEEATATAELVPDAHLAAIAAGHGLTVMSADTDFAKFPSVTWQNPLR